MNRLTRFFYFLNKRVREDSALSVWLMFFKWAALCAVCVIVGAVLTPDDMPTEGGVSPRIVGGLLGLAAFMAAWAFVMVFGEPVAGFFRNIFSHVRGAWDDANPKKDADGNPTQFGVIDDESEVADERRSNRLGR